MDVTDLKAGIKISIHAPRVGCDQVCERRGGHNVSISIHAPRVGCDKNKFPAFKAIFNFNPRTPGGVRLVSPALFGAGSEFQSTHPGWGATRKY